MHGQTEDGSYDSEVVPFSRTAKSSTADNADQLDKAGLTFCSWSKGPLALLTKTAAASPAQKLSDQLRAAESCCRVGGRSRRLSGKSRRAEQWLHRVYTEIEDRFLQKSDGRRAMSGAPQRPQNARRSR